MAVPVSQLQSINPGAIIELFTLTLDSTLHGASTVYRFHNGANQNSNAEVVWAGNTYQRFPIKCEGFTFNGTGTLPRPTVTISNILGTITAILADVNQTTSGNDLTGAKLTRIRTLARYLDAVNFTGNTNPFGTPNSNELPQEIFFIDRKVMENRNTVQFELVGDLDKQNLKLPKRQVTRNEFPAIGGFIN